ncbi:hypothetical protein C8F04DRAFT_1177253 [Mycena alexandri]|uniref:Uncharacterized protein n=1 Tax=Mycena alexandri TaxID=1745969 RepID=A0AAD6T7U0_9AGAR|nr:hypothetical protein C8F04DRAFT_1177253 [Mycena alexandri]
MTLCCKVLQRNSAASSISSRAQTTGGNFVFGPTPPQTGDILMSTQGIIMTPPRRVLRLDAERIARSSAAPSAVMAYSGHNWDPYSACVAAGRRPNRALIGGAVGSDGGHNWDPYSACVAAGRRPNRALIGGTVGSDGGHHWDPYSACVAAGRRTHHAPIGGAIGSDAASITEYSQGRRQTNRVLIGGAVGSDASFKHCMWELLLYTKKLMILKFTRDYCRGPLWKLRDVNDDEAAVSEDDAPDTAAANAASA